MHEYYFEQTIDIGDEFVVEVFFDERYGTMMFETIAGRSACPHEAKTLPNEKPIVKLLKSSSQFVFPDDPMVFEVVSVCSSGVLLKSHNSHSYIISVSFF